MQGITLFCRTLYFCFKMFTFAEYFFINYNNIIVTQYFLAFEIFHIITSEAH